MNVMKYLKSLMAILISIVLFTIILTTLSYFNIITSNINKYLQLIAIIISMLIGGIYIGKKSANKGYLEGLKIGIATTIVMFLLSYFGFKTKFNLENIIFYIVVIMSSTLGSIVGINKKLK